MKQITNSEQTTTLLEAGFNNDSYSFTIGDLINYLPKYIDCDAYVGHLCIFYVGNLWQINYDQDMYRGWQSKELIDCLYKALIDLKKIDII